MKKMLALMLSMVLVVALFAGCKKNNEPVDKDVNQSVDEGDKAGDVEEQDKEEPEQEETEDETPIVEADLEAGTKFNAFEQFDKESPVGENVPWTYNFTTDGGATFDPLTILEATDTLTPWHPWGGNWTGVGLNNDVPNKVELNTDGLDGIYGTLGFKAPVDGKYGIIGSVDNPWNQTADSLYVKLNGQELFTVQTGNSETGAVEFPYTVVELKKDEVVYFYCPSTEADSWVSAYLDVTIVYEPGDESVGTASGIYDSFKDFDTESAKGDNGPWLYYVTSDEGATFELCTVLEATDTLKPWHLVEGNWTGVGLNADVADYVELNTDSKGGMNGALSFKAPEDGTYHITGLFHNPWNQPAELLHVRLHGADILTVEPKDAESGPVSFEVADVTLKAGEEIFFFCPSTEEGGWVSAYINVIITK